MSSRPSGLSLAMGAAATWRLTHLLVEEDGPGRVVVRLRASVGNSLVGELLDCFYCTSIWVAAPVAATIAPRPREFPLAWLALSGAACLLEQLTAGARIEQLPGLEPIRG